MEHWAAQELKHLQLGDARLNRRLVRLVEDLSSQPTASVPQACENWANTKSAYRFWDSPRVTPKAIRLAHQKATLERICQSHEMVLAIQDTTELDFTHHPGKRGMGPLELPFQRGMKVHSVLAASIQGVPLGLIHQEVWSRNEKEIGKHHQRRKRETKDKESQRWISSLEATQQAIPEAMGVLVIADREADIYDFFAATRRAKVDLLVRATHNRRVNHEMLYLWQAIRQSPAAGQLKIELQRKKNQPPREALLTIRYRSLEILPPRNRRQRGKLEAIEVQVVLAEEEAPPSGTNPVCWLLITTLPVNSFEEALQLVTFYSYRWLIERYHFVLKSGCQVEELQLESAERIERALATYCLVAWHLLWLTYEARQNPDIACSQVLETHEWQSLYCRIHKTPQPPDASPSLHEAVGWIAQLGGFLARKHDGEPGVKTIWRGLRRLHDIAETWQLLHSPPSPPSTYG